MPHFGYFLDLGEGKREIVSDCLIEEGFSSLLDEKKETYKGRAIWDTGATHTCVSFKVVKTLGLQSTGYVGDGMLTASGSVPADECPKYAVNLVIPGFGLGHGAIEVAGANLSDDVLIGMDIIGMGEFAISHDKFSWCCPPCGNPIDLSKKAEKENEKIRKKRRR